MILRGFSFSYLANKAKFYTYVPASVFYNPEINIVAKPR